MAPVSVVGARSLFPFLILINKKVASAWFYKLRWLRGPQPTERKGLRIVSRVHGLVGVAACMAILVTLPLRAAEADRAAAGLDLAQKHCARCHAVGMEGESPHKEAPQFRSFAEKWPLENLEEALAEGIVTGHPDMPEVVLEPPEIDALIEHLRTLAPAGSQRKGN